MMSRLIQLTIFFFCFTSFPFLSAKVYVTQSKVGIDRIASAWLLDRFIDESPVFLFYNEGDTVPEGISYDYYGADFFHRGPDCTFITLIKHHKLLDNEALKNMNAAVNDVFAWQQSANSIGAVFSRYVADCRDYYGDDLSVYRSMFYYLDLLYLLNKGDPSKMLLKQNVHISQLNSYLLADLLLLDRNYYKSHQCIGDDVLGQRDGLLSETLLLKDGTKTSTCGNNDLRLILDTVTQVSDKDYHAPKFKIGLIQYLDMKY